MKRDQVVLVDRMDNALGSMDKIEAHIKGELHRAFSVFLFNSKGEMLIHQRAAEKYHGANLWTNACCSHPQWNEDIKTSALERLDYEMGLECNIIPSFSFLYNTPVENGLIEHEFDHVFIGHTDKVPNPRKEEVQDFKWILPSNLLEEIESEPTLFTTWFKMALPRVTTRNYLSGTSIF